MVLTPLAESLRFPLHEVLKSVESLLGPHSSFEPRTDSRTFTVQASDYVTLVLFRGLLPLLLEEAPGVKVEITPPQSQYFDQLKTAQAELLILPREIVGQVGSAFSRSSLFSDRYVCAVDALHPVSGPAVGVEDFSNLPYLSVSGGLPPSLAEAQLDSLELRTNGTLTTTSYVAAPFLLRGTQMVTLVYERLGKALEEAAGIRLLEPPVPMPTITETLYWHPRHGDDQGHLWLRSRIHEYAQKELF